MDTFKKNLKLQHEFSRSIVSFSFFTMVSLIVLLVFYLNLLIQDRNVSISIGFYILNLLYIIFSVFVNFERNLKASTFFRVSRKNYYMSSLGYFIVTALISSLIQLSILIIETFIFKYINIEQINYLNFIYNKLSFVGAIQFTAFTTLLFLTAALVMNFISVLQYRFGAKVWLFIFAAGFIVYQVYAFTNVSFSMSSENRLFLWILASIVSCILIFLNWIFVRKTDIKN